MSFKHFGTGERAQIEAMLACNCTTKRIAKYLQYSESGVSKEINRNSTQGKYSHKYAQEQSEKRRKKSKHPKKLADPKITQYIETKLKLYWSVINILDNIFRDTGESLCLESIYRYIYHSTNKEKKLWKFLRRSRKKRRKHSATRKLKQIPIANRISIHERPIIVEARSRIGDWELDTMIGANQQGIIGTFVDRTSRFVLINKMKNKTSAEMAIAASEKFKKIQKSKRKTMTADNGGEFACHEFLAKEFGIDFYFADPYSSWQRGTNENTNGLIRQFLPKGTEFTNVTQDELDHYAWLINNRPRRCLGNRTAQEVFDSS